MRTVLMAALALCALAGQAVPQKPAPQRKIPCKTAANAAMCYWTRGRLALYNGNPSMRMWKVGTKRILGVYSGPSPFPPRTSADSEDPELPANLDSAYDADYKRRVRAKDPDARWPDAVYADFEVCPLEPEHQGEMQSVCIESAKNIFVDPGGYVPRY